MKELRDKIREALISALPVTALVYLDGKVVDNSSVAANAAQSMTGTLNLQFSSDAILKPAEITSLRQGQKTNTGADGN